MGQTEPNHSKDQPKGTPERYLSASKTRLATLLTIFSFIFVLAVYVWLISCGLWSTWPPTTTYYDQLATSFSHGTLALELQPDPALLALPDPYDPNARAGIQVPTDISLYKGKFYLYFGPVPAFLIMAARVFIPGEIGDQYLVFIFVCGAFLIQTLLLLKVWKQFFPDLTPWLLPPGILAMGLIAPVGWVLSLPTVYNAAITGGEFFFIAGFFTAFMALDRTTISKWGLAAAGIFWAAALGSRITQILPIGFMMLMVMTLILLKHDRSVKLSMPAILALWLPLAVGSACLGWYNWARFGSVFETGIAYQLAGEFLQKYHRDLFSPVYIIQNFYNYLLIPPRLKSAFPFLIPIYGNLKPILPFLPLPIIYYSQEITGYLFNAPFILFALAPVIDLISKIKRRTIYSREEGDRSNFNWLIAGLSGSFLFGFGFFLVFFWVAMRYFADFIPALVMLSVIGSWQVHLSFSKRPASRIVYVLIMIGVIAISVIASNLLALSINSGRFRQFDPILWRQLVNFFRR